MRTVILLLAFVMILAVSAFSQVITITQNVWANQTIANGTSYTSADLPIAYSGTDDRIKGLIPDSIRIVWEAIAPGDTNDVKIYISKSIFGNAAQSYSLVDSCKDDEFDYFTVPRASFTSADKFKIKLTGAASGNTGAKMWVRYERWFKLP